MTIQEQSPDVAALAAALAALPVGDTVTYSTLSKVIGRDVRAVPWRLSAALAKAAADHGAVFATERRVGYKRLPANEANILGHNARRRIRRQAKRTSARLQSLIRVTNDMDEPTARKLYQEVNSLNLLAELSRDKAASAAVNGTGAPEPVGVVAQRMMAVLGIGK